MTALLLPALGIASFILIPVGNQMITGCTFGLTSGFSAMLVSIVLVFGVVVARREKTMIETRSMRTSPVP